ncbi:MAG TPA: PQQ-binding-like beta-propeller repeat protein [Candidatus Binataceae bacterium]
MRLLTLFLLITFSAFAQSSDAGRRTFEAQCARCHGPQGGGGELGPAITATVAARSDQELSAIITTGRPGRGMPAFQMQSGELTGLVTLIHMLAPAGRGLPPVVRKTVTTTDGKTLTGVVISENSLELQLRTGDNRVALLRPSGDRFRAVTSETDWPTYHGDVSGNRYSKLAQINSSNVQKLAPKWVFNVPGAARMEGTPIVVGGLMYVTIANECWALDAGTGREIWHFQRPRTRGLVGNASGGINRGVAISGDRLFMVSDHAHILALNRHTGDLLWDTEMADWHQNYNATSAPLVVGDLVVSGTAGGDEGARGFVAAFDRSSGKEVWRFWTAPRPGEAGSETWKGTEIEHPGAVTWMTGSYDPAAGIVFWATGNPGNDLVGDERGGDNLYSSSILALDAKTGKLRWYYQFTPHNVWDYDAQAPSVLVDAQWRGQPRKLLLHADRNGFFYVFDRITGERLLTKALVHNLTWAKEIGSDGRPVLNPNQEPTAEGTRICPALDGATNWYSTAFNPSNGLYYVQTLEACADFVKRAVEWKAGAGYIGGTARRDGGQKILRAIDIQTGDVKWELPQTGPANSWGGVLATAGGVVLFCEDGGLFTAADARTGKRLWQWPAELVWRSSPMTYTFDGKQYVAIAAGSNIVSFALMP